MSLSPSPYLKAGIVCALLSTLLGAAFFDDVAFGVERNDFCEKGGLAAVQAPPPDPACPPLLPQTQREKLIHIRDQFPLFPGCGETGSYAERKQCADKRMLAFIYDNVQYPAVARDNGVEGMAVVSFVAENDGSLSGFKLVRDPGAGTGDEAMRVVRLMSERGRWEPAQQANRPIRVRFNLPVRFKLEANELKKVKPKLISPRPELKTDSIFNIVPQMPMFPGCATGQEYAERKVCSDEKLLNFVHQNIRYPVILQQNFFVGMAVVSFVVEKDGSRSTMKLLRDPGHGLGEEALRVVRLMGERGLRWEPGRLGGNSVRVRFNLPVSFNLL